ncbi:MAG: hypothetical protein ACLUOF_08870 [Ruminococcus sp.]
MPARRTFSDPAAAQLIAHLSDGGMRDALSLLDQCASGGDAITAASVTAAAGVAGRDSVFAILEAVQAQDAAKALRSPGRSTTSPRTWCGSATNCWNSCET